MNTITGIFILISSPWLSGTMAMGESEANLTEKALTQIEEFCDGPTCEYLYWKPGQMQLDTSQVSSKKLLYFKNSIIPQIPIELFAIYPELKQLSMSNSYVEEIPDRMTSDTLEFLYLSGNKIRQVEDDAFKMLPNLKYLWLSGNQIDTLGSFAFDSMDNLLFLELSDNEITELPENLFKNAPKLTSLFLSNNKIKALSNNLFASTPSLYQLNIDNNDLMTIGDSTFKDVKLLNILDISSNPIKTLNLIGVNLEKLISDSSALQKLSVTGTVKALNFRNTPIRKMQLSESDRLEALVLSDCYLRDMSFVQLFPKLRVLNVSSNPMLKVDAEALNSLKYLEILSLANCNLAKLEVGTFDLLKELKQLDISHNGIEELELNALRPMRQLKNISIMGNQWSCCSLKSLIRYLDVRAISFKSEPKIEQDEGVYLSGINCVV